MNGGGLLHTGQSWPGRPKRSVKPLPISAPGRPQLSAAKAEGRAADAANVQHEMVGKTTRIPQRQHPTGFNAPDAVKKAPEARAKTSGGSPRGSKSWKRRLAKSPRAFTGSRPTCLISHLPRALHSISFSSLETNR